MMSIKNRPPTLSHIVFAGPARRHFSINPAHRASVLFALSSLSNSRETQHFNKLSHLSRVEHSPPLKLIKSSEVDPFKLSTSAEEIRANQRPAPASTPAAYVEDVNGRNRSGTFGFQSGARSTQRVWDEKALKLGRAIIADQARAMNRMQRALARSKRREVRQTEVMRRQAEVWRQEARKLGRKVKSTEAVAAVWIVLSIGTATVLAAWRFWPQRSTESMDSSRLGRKIAERARAAMPLPAAVSGHAAVGTPSPASDERVPAAQVRNDAAPKRNWWRSVFWMQP